MSAIIIRGNLTDGHSFVGPFDSEAEARGYAFANYSGGSDTQVVPLEPPRYPDSLKGGG